MFTCPFRSYTLLAVANLLAHCNISWICYCGQISLQSATVNCSCSDNLTPLEVTSILLAMVLLSCLDHFTKLSAKRFFSVYTTKQVSHYASPSSGEAYRDRRLTTNFELWVEFFCVPTCFHVRIPKPCLSVPRKNKSSWLRQYQSYIGNWYINGKVFTSTTIWKAKNVNFAKLR